MRYVATVVFERESHDVFTPVGAPVSITVEASNAFEAMTMADRHAQANPILEWDANAWRITSLAEAPLPEWVRDFRTMQARTQCANCQKAVAIIAWEQHIAKCRPDIQHREY